MVFPLHDDNSMIRITPGITWGIILINVLVFLLWELPQGPEQLQTSFFRYGMVPAEYTQGQDLPPLIPLPYWITLFTMMFIHGGFAHLFGNMLYLWIFGDNVEQAFGHLGFLVFYVLCGIGASLIHIVFNADSMIPSVGASGAISGVLAAYMIQFPRERVTLWSWFGLFDIPAVTLIGIWVAFQLINSISIFLVGAEHVGIAYLAHLGGFVVGIPLTFFFRWLARQSRRQRG